MMGEEAAPVAPEPGRLLSPWGQVSAPASPGTLRRGEGGPAAGKPSVLTRISAETYRRAVSGPQRGRQKTRERRRGRREEGLLSRCAGRPGHPPQGTGTSPPLIGGGSSSMLTRGLSVKHEPAARKRVQMSGQAIIIYKPQSTRQRDPTGIISKEEASAG